MVAVRLSGGISLLKHESWFHISNYAGAIKRKIELDWGTEDKEYLEKVETHVKGALNEVTPDVIVYNAGTDILDGDPLGGLSISPQVSVIISTIIHTHHI